jgi:hypothetical protein
VRESCYAYADVYYSAIVIALYRAIRVVCLHDVSMIAIGVEGADQGEEEPSHHHVAPGMSLPHEPSHISPCTRASSLPVLGTMQMFAGLVFANQNDPAPPSLEYLLTVHATESSPLVIGDGGHGNRLFIPITGGTFSGPKLQGTHCHFVFTRRFAAFVDHSAYHCYFRYGPRRRR